MEDKYEVVIKTPIGASPEYTASQLEAGRRKAGNELYRILQSHKLPTVVAIEEWLIPSVNPIYSPMDEFRITVTISPVIHKEVIMAHPSYYSPQRTDSFWKRLFKKLRGTHG